MPDVTFQHEQYKDSIADWELVSDVYAGERAVKKKGDTYLPVPNPKDKSKDNEERYSQYKRRAVFYGATRRTVQGLIGTAYKKPPTVAIPTGLEYLLSDADGAGVSLLQQSQKTTGATVKCGRHALYVDYPQTDGATSKAKQKAESIRANILGIAAKSVVNWKTAKIGGVHKLSLVVISEAVEEDTPDGFGVAIVEQYRALKLIDGSYIVELWRKKKDSDKEWVLFNSYAPTDGAGNLWNEIPFIFVGSENNDPDVDDCPILDMAIVNLAHYRNSADYEDSVFFTGQPQPWASGLSQPWVDMLEAKGVVIGARELLPLPEGGAFGFAQAQPNSLVKEAMDQKEKQLVALGARLIEKGQAVKTATEAQNDSEIEHSVLSVIAGNVSDAYTMAIIWAARFMKEPEKNIEYELNQEFIQKIIDAQMLTALIGAWQSGGLPKDDMWDSFKAGGLIDSEKSNEEIAGEVETDNTGLGLEE